MQISTLIGKQILSPNGEHLGYVTGAYLTRDLSALSALAAADEEEEEFFLPVKSVLSCSDAIIAQGTKISPVGVPVPLMKAAFTHTGGALGIVTDWQDGRLPCFTVSCKGLLLTVPAAFVRAEGTVLLYPEPLPVRKKTSKPKKPKTESVSSDPAQPDPTAPSGTPEPSPAPVLSEALGSETPEPSAAPKAVPLFYRGNLLGRRIKRNVFDGEGAPIALAGEKVTPEILSRARRKGKLLALTVNTIT